VIEIKEYLTTDGKSPFAIWLRELGDRQAQARIMTRLNRVRLGNFGDCKAVGEGVLELRMPFGPGYRVYFAREGEAVVLLLCGGDKGSQQRDIERARQYWQEYRSRDHG
jgi:putative addiction module killer protein